MILIDIIWLLGFGQLVGQEVRKTGASAPDLLGLPLHAGSNVLDGEAAMPHDGYRGILQLVVVDAVIGAVAHVAYRPRLAI